MITAMLMAHLLGDYVLQWDQLAAWKAQSVRGALFHGVIVLITTLMCALSVNPTWWPWALLIGLTHMGIDAIQPWLGRRVRLSGPGLIGLVRLCIDQTLHVGVIGLVIVVSGYATWPNLSLVWLEELRSNQWLALSLGYVFITMPAWVFTEFIAYGVICRSSPQFPYAARSKYIGTLERWIMATLVLLGQAGLVPLVALPRLVSEAPRAISAHRARVYLTEALVSVVLAVLIGLSLRGLFW